MYIYISRKKGRKWFGEGIDDMGINKGGRNAGTSLLKDGMLLAIAVA